MFVYNLLKVIYVNHHCYQTLNRHYQMLDVGEDDESEELKKNWEKLDKKYAREHIKLQNLLI